MIPSWYPLVSHEKNNHGCLKIECLPLQAFHSFQNTREIFMLYKGICKYPLGECQGLKFQKRPLEVPNKLKCKNITHMVPFSNVSIL
jgi:hypothetical protein